MTTQNFDIAMRIADAVQKTVKIVTPPAGADSGDKVIRTVSIPLRHLVKLLEEVDLEQDLIINELQRKHQELDALKRVVNKTLRHSMPEVPEKFLVICEDRQVVAMSEEQKEAYERALGQSGSLIK